MVYGSPQSETHGFLRNQAFADHQAGPAGHHGRRVGEQARVPSGSFRTRLRNAFEAYRSPSVNIDVLLTWGTTSSSVNVRQDDRLIGDPGYSLRKPSTTPST